MMSTATHQPIPLVEIEAARQRLAGTVVRTPLVKLNLDRTGAEIYLKLENLQPIGSFKLRGAANAMFAARRDQLERGVWTASAGNMAQGVAYCARELGVRCEVVVPDNAPETKLAAIRRLGGHLVPVPFDQYQQIQVFHGHPGMEGMLIHPFGDPAVMAGNGTIGLEILDELPEVDAIVVPYGGGGLSCGIASAIRARKPAVKVYAAEVETGAPLAASLAAGEPTRVDYRHSFVTGMGAPYVFAEMWSLASQLLDGSLVVALSEVADAIRLMAERNHVIAEGAGAVPVAAALAGVPGGGKVVCVVSGGNIDPSVLLALLGDELG